MTDAPGERLPRPLEGAAALAGAAVLLAAYLATLAPGLTFWDAGEFIAAAHSLGIPHPPGTPLFVLIIHVWAKLFFFLPFAVATNLFSAVATAAAAAIAGRLIHRGTGSGAMALAAVLVAGGMSSVWLNATETEVYAASLLLGMCMIWAGERAGRDAGVRWSALVAYLMALAVPLHLSALLLAPTAILLAAYAGPGAMRWRRAVALAGVFLVVMGVGRVSWMTIAIGAVVALGSVAIRDERAPVERLRLPLAALVAMCVGTTALAFLYVRAQHDPLINQGNPATWQALTDVVARRQYAVSPMWPRMAPLWVQFGNLGQYADWQVALSTGPTVLPSIARSLMTAFFLLLGYTGAVEHYRRDRRTFLAMALLLACGTVGVVAYLNMHAGPSIAYGILPSNTVREARERDYFFIYGFFAWGLWAGVGAVAMAREYRKPAWTGVLLATLPLVLNWRAVTRRTEPERSLPMAVAEGLLGSAPERAVLFVVGDNDSYPLWYAQAVHGMRRDVTVVTIPLLPTRWYREEMARRQQLLDSADLPQYARNLGTASAVARNARALGRPVAAALTLNARERARLVPGVAWTLSGYSYVADTGSSADSTAIALDTTAAATWAAWFDREVPRRETRETIDPVHQYFLRLLQCPEQLLAHARGGDSARVDSVCNYR